MWFQITASDCHRFPKRSSEWSQHVCFESQHWLFLLEWTTNFFLVNGLPAITRPTRTEPTHTHRFLSVIILLLFSSLLLFSIVFLPKPPPPPPTSLFLLDLRRCFQVGGKESASDGPLTLALRQSFGLTQPKLRHNARALALANEFSLQRRKEEEEEEDDDKRLAENMKNKIIQKQLIVNDAITWPVHVLRWGASAGSYGAVFGEEASKTIPETHTFILMVCLISTWLCFWSKAVAIQ